MSFNFTVIKKNQILAVAVTLMIVTAGYLNYKYDPTRPYDIEATGKIEENRGDAVLVDLDSNIQDLNDYTVSIDGTTPVFQNNTDLSGNSIFENDNVKEEKVFNDIEDYFISTKIDRTNSYAEQIESYENILNGVNINEEQKNRALSEIEKINNIRNSIMIAENLIKLKGFEEAVVLVNEKSVNVIVAAENLTSIEVAQLQSIIVNEFMVDIGNIHIINYD